MTVAAVVAGSPSSEGEAFVGCIADSRLYYDDEHVEDGFDKLFPLGSRACAVGAGLQEPFLAAHDLARREIERENETRGARGERALAIWEIARVFFGHLRREGQTSGTQNPLHALIAGFSSDGSAAIAGATFHASGGYALTLYKPKRGEVVVQTIGAAAARSLVAEALAMDFAPGEWRIDHVVSLLRDLGGDSARETSDFRNVGGAPTVSRCTANGSFEFPICEIDGQHFHRGQWVPRTAGAPGQVDSITYAPVFQDLDARNEVQRHFVGGQPRAVCLYTPPQKPGLPEIVIGARDLFCGDEPTWAFDESEPVVVSMPVGQLLNLPSSGLHPNDGERFAQYQKRAKKPRRPKKR